MDESERIRCTLLSMAGPSGTWIGFACRSHGLQYVVLIARGGSGDELDCRMWRVDGASVDLAYWALRCRECGAELAGPCASSRTDHTGGGAFSLATVPVQAINEMAALVSRLERTLVPVGTGG